MIKNEDGKVKIYANSTADIVLEVQEIILECQKRIDETDKDSRAMFDVMVKQTAMGEWKLHKEREKNIKDIEAIMLYKNAVSNLCNVLWEKRNDDNEQHTK